MCLFWEFDLLNGEMIEGWRFSFDGFFLGLWISILLLGVLIQVDGIY